MCQCSMNFFKSLKAHFSKRLKQFSSTLLLYTATMVWTTMMPQFSFWDQSYWFAPNFKFQSATKDREKHTSKMNYHKESIQDKAFLAKI